MTLEQGLQMEDSVILKAHNRSGSDQRKSGPFVSGQVRLSGISGHVSYLITAYLWLIFILIVNREKIWITSHFKQTRSTQEQKQDMKDL